MAHFDKFCIAAALTVFGVAACTGEGGHADDTVQSSTHTQEARGSRGEDVSVDHSKFGHVSAIYLCGNDELQTMHTDTETKLAYKGQKIDVARTVSAIDNAFVGESFKGKLNGEPLYFRGMGYDASLKIGNEVLSCEKLSCIPLGGPH